ncbi:MAG: hypothetical protein IPG45_33850 [Deltaproteobacteria bacterium]|nr:hypothetical protein [Deltaproteobacteria bacterium]
MRAALLLLASTSACIETPALDFEILLPGAEGGVVLVDRGAGRPDQFEAHAVRIAPDSGALQDFTLVTSATTVTFVGYPCPLERYGWAPGSLDLRPGAKLPTGAVVARRLLLRELDSIEVPRHLSGIGGQVPIVEAEAPSVRGFHGGYGARIAGGRPRVIALDAEIAAMFVPNWGVSVFGRDMSSGDEGQEIVLFDAKGAVGFDGLVGLTAGSPSALVRFPAPAVFDFARSDRPALRGLAGGFEAGVPTYYSIDILRDELVQMTISGTTAVTRTFTNGVEVPEDEAFDLVWTEPGRLFLVGAKAWPLELTDGRLRERQDLPGSKIAAGAGRMVAVDGERALIGASSGQGPWLEWDCPLPAEPVAAAIRGDEVAIAGIDGVDVRSEGACGACYRLEPSAPLAQVRDMAYFPGNLFVLQNAFDAQFAITTWLERP